MKTSKATAIRMARYDAAVRSALPHIQAARTLGGKNAREFADYLNAHAITSPAGATWTESAVLRCLRRLWELRLDDGSLSPWSARTFGGPRVRKVASQRALKAVEEFAGPTGGDDER